MTKTKYRPRTSTKIVARYEDLNVAGYKKLVEKKTGKDMDGEPNEAEETSTPGKMTVLEDEYKGLSLHPS